MNLMTIQDSLLDNKKVAAVMFREDEKYENKRYPCIITCEISVLDLWIPVIIGIPSNWSRVLMDIFVTGKGNFPFIPHMDTKGKLCLFDLEGVLIDQDLCGLLNQCIDRSIQIITEGLTGKNKNDFLEEFDLYWCQLPNIKKIKFSIPKEKRIQKIFYSEKRGTRRKKESYVTYLQRTEMMGLFATVDHSDFATWNIEGTRQNGMYIYLEAKNIVLPPDARKKLDLEYVNDLLKLVEAHTFINISNKMGKDKVLVFEIVQPNGIRTCFGVIIRNAFFSKTDDNMVKVKSYSDLQPLSINRIDKKYLMSRTSEESNILENKKYLLIGCGSIGGYVLNEMINAGCEDITLVDRDILKEENIFRHLLGMEYIDNYKAEALSKYFYKNIPEVNLKPIDEEIENIVNEGDLNLADFDVIISAAGNHNVNRWINTQIYEKSIDVPVIYAWNEPLDIGCHVAYIKLSNRGCYECFFGRDIETNELYDVTAYSEKGQLITKNLLGCGGSFIPYGSTVSLKTAVICTDLLKKVISDRCNENILISSKGEGYYYEKAGLIISDAYNNQKEGVLTVSGSNFAKMNCEMCGKINDI